MMPIGSELRKNICLSISGNLDIYFLDKQFALVSLGM